jgi:antitoxin component of MazEF toxin-antitoxin module
MATKTMLLEVADDGTLTIPDHVIRTLQLLPGQTIIVEVRENTLVITPSHQENLNRIGELLRDALAGVEWSEVEAERQDRWF